MVNLDSLIKIAAQKIFISVEIKRNNNEITHTLIIQNQSEFNVLLIDLKTIPNIPLGFGNDLPIDDSKIFKNKILIPGQKIENTIDKKSIKDPRAVHEITARYKFIIFDKEIPKIQISNACKYRLLDHTVPVMAALTQKYDL